MKIEKTLYTIEEAFFAALRESADEGTLRASLMYFLDIYKEALKIESESSGAFEIAVNDFVIDNYFKAIPAEVKDFLGIDENARIYE